MRYVTAAAIKFVNILIFQFYCSVYAVGTLMRIALETCSSIEDFESLLDFTYITGRKDCWNFGVLDVWLSHLPERDLPEMVLYGTGAIPGVCKLEVEFIFTA
jgi:hypothetical protein